MLDIRDNDCLQSLCQSSKQALLVVLNKHNGNPSSEQSKHP